jgi:hypothetical protein
MGLNGRPSGFEQAVQILFLREVEREDGVQAV